MTQDEFYSKLMQDVEYIFKTGFKLSPEMFMQTMSYASEQYELLSKRITELEALQAPNACETCKYYDGSHTCLNENSIAFETSNRVYGDDFCKDYDTRYKAKDSK